jgi:prepilin-type N-terminal cleavage/methylation domain-containing protein
MNNNFLKNWFALKTRGFTLLEMIVYIALVAIIGTAIGTFAFNIVRIGGVIKNDVQILDNARRAMDILTFEIRNSRSVYWPTSVFNSNPGQLSLEQTATSSSAEEIEYTDFFKCGNSLCLRREGQSPVNLTGDKIKINNLMFNYLENSTSSKAVRITIEFSFGDEGGGGAFTGAETLVTSVKLRNY